jgi:hypothetical protein
VLQQSSRQLQAAVAELLAGQLPVAQHIKHWQQAQALVGWLSKHACLMQSLQLQLPTAIGSGKSSKGSFTYRRWAADIPAAMGGALLHAAAANPLKLQSFELKGAASTPSILWQLPAAL